MNPGRVVRTLRSFFLFLELSHTRSDIEKVLEQGRKLRKVRTPPHASRHTQNPRTHKTNPTNTLLANYIPDKRKGRTGLLQCGLPTKA